MQWSNGAWQEISGIYENILAHPFINQLMAGTLPAEQFRFYIAQDALYLGAFSRALALIGARAHDTDTTLQFVRFAEGAVVVEQALHASFFKTLDIAAKGSPSPTCLNYTNFLMAKAALAPVEEAMAAVLPCFWIYKKVGDHILQHQSSGPNPYQEWINTYSGEAFGILVQKAIALCDAAAQQCTPAQQQRMLEHFVTASRFEWMFWDSAWRLEQWPV